LSNNILELFFKGDLMVIDADNVRERTEKIEHMLLSDNAAFSDQTKGRERPEPPSELRTEYQRDRDRIIHCKAFRRLKHKTQVFLSPEGDHYRTRLTHTLEVSQIARTIARALRLNEDLTEAISLGHDLGHTPFGHAGERALNDCSEIGFHHYEQSVRVVEQLEKDGQGLNLTREVRNGILCHTTGAQADTLEGRIVRISDRIAYINHDIDDAVRAGVLSEEDIPLHLRETLGFSKSQRIDSMVRAVIAASGDDISVDESIRPAMDELHEFLNINVYHNPVAKGEEGKVDDMIKRMFCFFVNNSDKLPSEFDSIREKSGVERAALDYIAGMTDRYAVQVYLDLFVPKSWQY
jgi:dGTPase